jgi:hypothetical protein
MGIDGVNIGFSFKVKHEGNGYTEAAFDRCRFSRVSRCKIG